MSYTPDQIADMLLRSGSEFVANKISSEWEPIKAGMTLKDCLADALAIYGRTIADEVAYDSRRKMNALGVELRLRIRQKQVSAPQ